MKSLLVMTCLSLMTFASAARADWNWGILGQNPGPSVPAGTYLVSGRKAVAPQPPPILAPVALSPADPGAFDPEPLNLQPGTNRGGDVGTIMQPEQGEALGQADAPDFCAGTYVGKFGRGNRAVVTFTGDGGFTVITDKAAYQAHGTCEVRSGKNATVSFALDGDESYVFQGQIVLTKDNRLLMSLHELKSGRAINTVSADRQE
jgi:hypothetical protein